MNNGGLLGNFVAGPAPSPPTIQPRVQHPVLYVRPVDNGYVIDVYAFDPLRRPFNMEGHPIDTPKTFVAKDADDLAQTLKEILVRERLGC